MVRHLWTFIHYIVSFVGFHVYLSLSFSWRYAIRFLQSGWVEHALFTLHTTHAYVDESKVLRDNSKCVRKHHTIHIFIAQKLYVYMHISVDRSTYICAHRHYKILRCLFRFGLFTINISTFLACLQCDWMTNVYIMYICMCVRVFYGIWFHTSKRRNRIKCAKLKEIFKIKSIKKQRKMISKFFINLFSSSMCYAWYTP